MRSIRATFNRKLLGNVAIAHHQVIAIPAVAIRIVEVKRDGTHISFHKVSHQIPIPHNRKAISGLSGNHHSVLGPISESVALVSCCCECASGALFVGATAAYRTARRCVGRGVDFIGIILGGANKAHRKAKGTVVRIDSVDVTIVEVHIISGLAIFVRGQPVAPPSSLTVEGNPDATACSRQENCACSLQCVPLRSRNHIAVVTRATLVRIA